MAVTYDENIKNTNERIIEMGIKETIQRLKKVEKGKFAESTGDLLNELGATGICELCMAMNDFSLGDRLHVLDILENEWDGTAMTPLCVEQFLEATDNPVMVSKFLSALKNSRTVELIPVIARTLGSSDKRVRANAVEAISAISSSLEAARLLFPFLHDEDNRVKANTAVALWKYEELRERIKDIFDEMVMDERKWMRASAYYAFGEIGLSDFVQKLLDGLADSDEDACKTAVVALIGYSERFGM
ncbi:MAG: hypothetical protein CVV64_09555 [Candidatus Wallbacteria bacterium HGW-Wallbacteria-1]|jgi:hypothetical protein|uniref:HEAT repeat domain-containing protein n=1 Tax=Candidatus Wallbacteria bacterium HGW-Wallbacteria-1 TaxID=2013854 RepID=A0A2N1PQP2_9BACT|nr:MAG: hypothetical protein CVV64_09555 [Candidatus Wallbacteria bacterium HGW-Wallbacteria-1]